MPGHAEHHPPLSLRTSILLGGFFGAALLALAPSSESSRVVVDVEHAGPETFQLFHSSSADFSEERSLRQEYAGRAVLRFDVPSDTKSVRLDPGGSAGRYSVHLVSVECTPSVAAPSKLRGQDLAGALSLPHLVTIEASAEGIVTLNSVGDDPHAQLTTPDCHTTGRSVVLLGARSFVGFLGGGVFAALAFSLLGRLGASKDLAFPAAYLVLTILSVTPFLFVRFPPLVDAGLHAGQVAVWHHHADPAWHFAEYYGLRIGPAPYAAYYGGIHLLAYLVGVERAAWLFVFFAVVSLPAASYYYCTRVAGTRWPSLLSFGLIYTFSLNFGFIAFQVGLSVAIFAIALLAVQLESPTRSRGVAIAGLGILTYFFHLLPWGFWMGGSAILVLFKTPTLRARMRGMALLIPGFLAGVLVTLTGRHLHMGKVQLLQWKSYPFLTHAREFFEWIWNACTNGYSQQVGIVLTICIVMSLLLSGLKQRWAALAIAGFTLGCYFLLPRSILQPAYWWALNCRFAAVAVLMLGLSMTLRTGVQRVLFAVGLSCCLLLLVDANRHWYGTKDFGSGFAELAAKVEKGQRTFFLIRKPFGDAHYQIEYKRTFPGYFQAMNGGFMAWNFDEGFPLTFLNRFPGPPFNIPNFRWDRHARYYDYLMEYGVRGGELTGHEGEVVKVGESHGWTLWKLPGPRDDTPPHPPYPSDKSFW